METRASPGTSKSLESPNVYSSGKIDYLTDPRLPKLTFISIKKHVEAPCVSRGLPSEELKKKLLGCATKFAIVAVADEYSVELDTLLDEVGPIKAFTPGFKNVDRKLHEAKAVDERRKKLETVAILEWNKDIGLGTHARFSNPF